MRSWRRSYTAYSLGCAVVWAGILVLATRRGDDASVRAVRLTCCGWWMGWLSATIARSVYPPPGSAVAPLARTAPPLR
jgi:hypothetical protein